MWGCTGYQAPTPCTTPCMRTPHGTALHTAHCTAPWTVHCTTYQLCPEYPLYPSETTGENLEGAPASSLGPSAVTIPSMWTSHCTGLWACCTPSTVPFLRIVVAESGEVKKSIRLFVWRAPGVAHGGGAILEASGLSQVHWGGIRSACVKGSTAPVLLEATSAVDGRHSR